MTTSTAITALTDYMLNVEGLTWTHTDSTSTYALVQALIASITGDIAREIESIRVTDSMSRKHLGVPQDSVRVVPVLAAIGLVGIADYE